MKWGRAGGPADPSCGQVLRGTSQGEHLVTLRIDAKTVLFAPHSPQVLHVKTEQSLPVLEERLSAWGPEKQDCI